MRGKWRRLRDLLLAAARRPVKQLQRRPPALSTRGSRRAGRRAPLHGHDACRGVSQLAARGGGAQTKLLELFEGDVTRFYLARRGCSKADGAAERRVEAFRSSLAVA